MVSDSRTVATDARVLGPEGLDSLVAALWDAGFRVVGPTVREALLWIVPSQAAGRWSIDGGTLTLTQMHQVLYGTLSTANGDQAISKARMRGYDITFTAGDRTYTGRQDGNTMQGTVTGPTGTSQWKASRGAPTPPRPAR